MSAGSEVQAAVERIVRDTNQKVVSRGMRAANAIRNAEIDVLSGNKSPAAPGTPPGRRSGHLKNAWVPSVGGGASSTAGGICIVPTLESQADYSGYVQDGTYKMAARPYKDPIIEKAVPEIESIFSSL